MSDPKYECGVGCTRAGTAHIHNIYGTIPQQQNQGGDQANHINVKYAEYGLREAN